MEKVILGKVRSDYPYTTVAGETLYLYKHSWDCDWYWGFGYIGNKNLHTHFSELVKEVTDVEAIFDKTKFTQKQWWILRDLFVQAYALKKCAETYRRGGGQSHVEGTTDIIRDKEMEIRINQDLEKVLNKIWEIVTGG